jgi:putative ABC transport system substrate-binding protein
MRRREFITLVGGTAVAWPFAGYAQQSAMPVIGFLRSNAPEDTPELLTAFREGLKDTGFAEGQNVIIEYRFANNQNERLPALAADLVRRQVAVIFAPASFIVSRWDDRIENKRDGGLHCCRLGKPSS